MFTGGQNSNTPSNGSAKASPDSALPSSSSNSATTDDRDAASSPFTAAVVEGMAEGSGGDNIDEQLLGVTVCILPPKKTSSSE